MKKIWFTILIILSIAVSITIFTACDDTLSPDGTPSTPDGTPPTPNLYTVSFQSGESAIEPYEGINEGDKIQKPADPTKAHYDFGGWYKDVEFTQAWNFARDPVVDNMTLYGKWNSHFEYEDVEGGCLVVGLTSYGKAIKNLEIPTSNDGKTVVGLGENAFFGCRNLESVVMPDNIETIPYGTFSGCENLASVTLPSSLTKIGYSAFGSCKKLTAITLPDLLTTIEYSAFEHCPNIKTITFSTKLNLTTVEGGTFDQTKWFESQPKGNVYLNKLLYKYKGELPPNSVVDIEEGTVAIAQYAFYEQSGLVEINFPESLTTINERAFTRTGLRTIKLTKNIADFSAACFGQDNIESITLEEGNTSFSVVDNILYDASGETLVMFPNDTRTTMTVPEGVKTIGNSAFRDNEYLTSVLLPSTLETIGVTAFMSTRQIKFLELPNSVREIGQQAFDYSAITYISFNGDTPSFADANKNIVYFVDESKVQQYKNAWDTDTFKCKIYAHTSLSGDFLIDGDVLIKYFGSDSNVTIPAGIKVIGEYAFYSNLSVSNVEVTEGVEEIKEYAFSSSGLHNIALPDSLKIIGDSAFHFCQSLFNDFIIPKGVEDIRTGAFRSCFNLANFVVSADNARYYSIDGVLFDKVLKMLVAYPNRNGYTLTGAIVAEQYIVPDGIEIIGEYAFTYTFIKNIILPDSLKIIRDNAFFSCEYLETLLVPNSVTDIGGTAFTYCVRLKSIVIPKSVVKWGINPFRDFKAHQIIYFRGAQISIPTTVLNCDAQFVFDYNGEPLTE